MAIKSSTLLAATTFAVVVACTAAIRAEVNVGAAVVKITPAMGTPLAGYYHTRLADGVLDDLFAKAIVFERDNERAAIVVLDLISTARPLVEKARAEIERTSGICRAKCAGERVLAETPDADREGGGRRDRAAGACEGVGGDRS
jgi:hypothetical protein